jgi:phosphatidylglycerophosphate synthase
MTETLVVPYWKACPAPRLRLLGVEFEDRIVWQSRRAGFRNFLLQHEVNLGEQLPEQFLVLFPNLLLSDAAWKRLKEFVLAPDTVTIFKETESVSIIRCGDAKFLADAFRDALSYPELLTKLSARLKRELVSIGDHEWIAFRHESDRSRAEKWMLRRLIKDSEGFMSRHLERKISLAVSRRLANTRVTPNAMTLVSTGIGLVSAVFFARRQRRWHVLGACLFWVHSVLDGCDGELARLKFAESRVGGLLDFWGDNAVHSAIFSAIGIGLAFEQSRRTPLVLSALAVGGTLLSSSLVYWTTMKRRISEGPLFTSVLSASPDPEVASAAEKIADQLARRDFIYLVVVLAVVGKLSWFLWMGAIGAPLYFLALTAFGLKNSSAASRPVIRSETSFDHQGSTCHSV